jgi:outer membrane immunogenic protein
MSEQQLLPSTVPCALGADLDTYSKSGTTMHRFFAAFSASAFAIAVTLGAAAAADLAVKAAPAVPIIDWSGFYVGGEIGGQSSKIDLSNPTLGTVGFRPDHDSFALGAFVGAQRQFGSLVVGVEGGYLAGFFNANLGQITALSIFVNPDPNTTGTAYAKMRDIWSGGARLGWAGGNLMVYVTGGYATGSFKFNAQNIPPSPPASEQASATPNGGYIGVGLDWAANNNWIIGAEFRHYAFGAKIVTATISQSNPFTETVRIAPSTDTAVVRVSYKFGWPIY